MSHVRRLITWFHTAAGQPRLAAGEPTSWRRVLPVALVGLGFAAVLVGARVGMPHEVEPVDPFTVGEMWEIGPELTARGTQLPDELAHVGYDGQWFLGQAHDPLLLTDMASTFDAPRYRSLRVAMPAAGWLLAAGQPALIPYALLVIELLAVALGCAACARIVTAFGRSRWWGAVFAVIPGVVVGVAYGTAEPLGLALAALGISLVMSRRHGWARRYGWAGLAFAGATLTKETYLAFALGAALYLAVDAYVQRERWLRPVAAVMLPGVVSLLAWWAYVQVSLPPDVNYGALERFQPPFVGWWEVLGAIARGDYPRHTFLFFGTGNELVLIATLVVLVAAVGFALKLRQSLLAYLAVGQGLFGLILAGFLLERFASAQRALAPAVLATVIFLITVRLGRRRPTGAAEARVPETVEA